MPSNQSALGGVRYTMIYQDATSLPSKDAATAYSLSNPLPAGLVEQVGVRLTGTYGAGEPLSAATLTELFSGLRFTFNGNQWCNMQTQGNDVASVNQSRMGGMLQDIGGLIVEDSDATNIDLTMWIPCGMNMPNNSRFELALNMVQSAYDMSGGNFEIWIKYGKSTNQTIITNREQP